METIFTSKKTDPKTYNVNNYGWVVVKNGKIIRIGTESVREGGIWWGDSFNSNGSLKTCMKTIARRWPNLYKKTCKYCQTGKLPTAKKIRNDDLTHDILSLEKAISKLNTELSKKKALLKKWKI